MCFLPVPSFPWKQLGFIVLALKAWMVENNTLYRLVKSPRGLSPPAQRVSQSETLFLRPAKECPMKPRYEHENSQKNPSCEIGAVSEKQPEKRKTNVPPTCLVESGHQNQTRRLAQRFLLIRTSGAPPTAHSHSTPHSSSHLSLFLPPFLLLSSFLAFYPPLLLLCPPSLHFLPGTLPPPHSRSDSSSTLTFGRKTTGDEVIVKASLSWNSCCVLWLSTSPLSAPYTSIVGFRRWFIYTLAENYTWRTV